MTQVIFYTLLKSKRPICWCTTPVMELMPLRMSFFEYNSCSCVALLQGKSITQQLRQDVLYRMLTFIQFLNDIKNSSGVRMGSSANGKSFLLRVTITSHLFVSRKTIFICSADSLIARLPQSVGGVMPLATPRKRLIRKDTVFCSLPLLGTYNEVRTTPSSLPIVFIRLAEKELSLMVTSLNNS